MKDENGIEICCENCRHYEYCDDKLFPDTGTTANSCGFLPSVAVYEARIAELQNELAGIKEAEQIKEPSESFYQRYSGVSEEYALGALEQCATEADELQARVKDLESKLTEIVKLLGERSRECGELEAHNEVLQRRIEEFSMELLDYNMKENRDVLERLKQAESEEK